VCVCVCVCVRVRVRVCACVCARARILTLTSKYLKNYKRYGKIFPSKVIRFEKIYLLIISV